MSAEPAVVTELVALCINEPRGDHGLEGYQRGETYRCELAHPDYPSPRYYRIYPGEQTDYYECAIPRVFTQYFQIEEKSS